MAGPSWNDAWDVGKEVLKHAGKKGAEEVVKGNVNVPGKDAVVEGAKTVAKAAGVPNVDLWSQALGLAKNWYNAVGDPAKEATLRALTTTANKESGYKHPAKDTNSPRFIDERSVGDPYQEGKGWNQRWSKAEGEYPQWAKAAYENPQVTADIVGAVVPSAVTMGAAQVANWWAQGEKPRSSYAAPVSPTRGGYNSSVESAEASAFYKHQLEEQKFAHKIALQEAREQSRIPGPQNTSVGNYGGTGLSSADPFGGLISSSFGNTRQFL